MLSFSTHSFPALQAEAQLYALLLSCWACGHWLREASQGCFCTTVSACVITVRLRQTCTQVLLTLRDAGWWCWSPTSSELSAIAEICPRANFWYCILLILFSSEVLLWNEHRIWNACILSNYCRMGWLVIGQCWFDWVLDTFKIAMVASYHVNRTILNILQHCILDRVIVMPELDSWLWIHLTCARMWEWEQHIGCGGSVSFSVSWSAWYDHPFAFKALYKLSNVWLFRGDCKLQVLGKSDYFKWKCILVSALCRKTTCRACFGCFHCMCHVRRTLQLFLPALEVHLLVLVSGSLAFPFIRFPQLSSVLDSSFAKVLEVSIPAGFCNRLVWLTVQMSASVSKLALCA